MLCLQCRCTSGLVTEALQLPTASSTTAAEQVPQPLDREGRNPEPAVSDQLYKELVVALSLNYVFCVSAALLCLQQGQYCSGRSSRSNCCR